MATADGAELSVPDDADPKRCPYCSYPFQRERQRTLHLGIAHEDELDEAERERYEEEVSEEDHDLFTLHVKLIIVILLTYFAMSYTYMFVWT